jgi:hypothetical protein
VRWRLAAVTLVACLVIAVQAQGQSLDNRLLAMPEFGIAQPTGDLGEDFNQGGLNAGTGLNGGLGLMRLFGGEFGLGLRWRYIQLPIQDIGAGDVNVSGHIFDVSANLFLQGTGGASPFFHLGMLIGKPKISGEADRIPFFPVSGRVSGTIDIGWRTGFNIGLGFCDVRSSWLGMFIAGEYNHLSTDGAKAEIAIDGDPPGVPDSFDVNINSDWMALRVGVMIFLDSGL